MTFSRMPIRRISIEAFRGFRDRQDFDLSASAVVLAGPNGTGKTSFFDALQWCLVGSIERLEDLRARKSVEHIVNQYRLNDRASVEVELSIDGTSTFLRRTGDRSGSTLELSIDGGEPTFGEDAERALSRLLVPSEGLTLEVALTTSGLMQQDVMRAVLEAKPADRYKHISTVLGLGSLEDFEDEVQAVAKGAKALAESARDERDAAGASLDRARERLEAATNRIASLPRAEQIRSEVEGKLRQAPSGVVVDLEHTLDGREDYQSLATDAGSLIQSLNSFAELWDHRQRTEASLGPDEPTEEKRQELESALVAAQGAVESAESELAAVESRLESAISAAEEMAQLASIAIPLLSDECPVCGQAIDPEVVAEELHSRSSQTRTTIVLREEAQSARARRREARETLASVEAALRSVVDEAGKWSDARAAAERARSAWEGISSEGPIGVASSDESDLAQQLPAIVRFFQELHRLLLDALDSLERATDEGDLARAQSEVASFNDVFESRAAKLEEVSQRAQRLKSLADAAVEARVEVTERRFRAIQPLVADIFGRLDPHPAFKTIEFELDTYYRRGTTTPMVRDLVEEVTADPLMVFSTSQANIAALSYFLAMGWSAGERRLPFVLLDDPVQSMDDVNVLGFADLCRHLRRERQLLISTHERRFASLLERKLAPRSESESTIVLEFVAWDRSGPAVESRRVPAQLVEDPIRVVQAAG